MGETKAEAEKRVKAVYLFMAQDHNGTGESDFVIPARVVASMIGYKITEHRHVVEKILKKYGKKGVDWKYLSRAVVFKDSNAVSYPIPGTTGVIEWTKGRGNHKYAFITLRFARELMLQSNTPLSATFKRIGAEAWDCIEHIKITRPTEPEVVKFRTNVKRILDEASFDGSELSKHNAIRDAIALQLRGQTEKKNSVGVADVETKDDVFEVKPLSEWLHGVGQILGYGMATKKRKRLILFSSDNTPSHECKRLCSEYDIHMEFIDTN
jgi:hypothetical protein